MYIYICVCVCVCVHTHSRTHNDSNFTKLRRTCFLMRRMFKILNVS